MKNKTQHARKLSSRHIRLLVRKALKAEICPASPRLDQFTKGKPSLARSLPKWVRRYGLLAGDKQYLLWCEPIRMPAETFPSQAVIDVPRGRYMIDTFDTVKSSWISRESAEGGPLVIGLTYTGAPVLFWISRRTG